MSITFKVAYGTDQKVVKYANSTLVSEVLAQCIKKFRVPTSGEDHALLLPTLPNRPGKWLATDRTLEQSDVQANDIVEFRKKHAQLKIKLTDGTTKTLLVDTSIPTIEVCKFIGDKILIRNGEEFGIQMDKGDSLSHWLDPNKTLGEQGVTEDSHLIYKKKFFVDDAFISTDDPASIHLLYMEAHDAIVAGAYPCSLQEAILFAAFQCQFELRNYTPEQHHEGTLKLEKFLPPAYLKTKNVETAVFKEHKKLSGMTEVNAKFRYIQLCRSLKTYGMSLFKIQVPKTSNNKKLVDKFLGITKQGLFLLDGKTKAIEKEYPLDHLRRWSHTETTFTLDFGTYEADYLNCFTSQGEAINNLISGYIDLILKKLQSQGPGGGLVDGASGTAEISADLVDRPAVKKGVVNTSSFVARTEESYSPTFYTSARRAGRPTASASQPAIVQELSAAVLSINRLLDESDKEEASKTEEGGEGEGKAPRKDTGESGFQTDSQELAAIPESEKEAVRTQIAQNVTVMNEAVAKLLGPLAHASVLSSPEILDLHKQYAPQVATMVESILAISKGTKGITTKARAAMLSSAKNIAATMSNFLLATQEASSNPNDPITRENVFKYSTQIVPSLVLMEAISRGTTIGDVDPRVIDLAHQTAKPATALQEALARVIEKYESPVLKAHAQLLAAQLSNTDRQLRELTEGFAPFLEDPAVKKTLFDTLKIYNANLNYLEQIASIESVEGAEAIRFTITDLKGALNSLSIHAVGAEIEPPKVEKAPEPEKVPEPVVEEDNTDKMIQDELESATKAIRELGETLRETQHLRRQTIKFKPGKVVDPKQLEKELLTEELGEGILDATKNIAGASEKLMLIAIGLQKELVAAGRAGKSQNLYKKDPAWAQGLISASQTVTFTIRQLVVAAQAASRGDDVDEERLQVLASNVNAAAIRLVTSAKVKAVPGSQFVSQLGDATKAVSSSTGHLLEKAKKPAALVELVKEEKKQSELSMTSKAVREIEVQTQILKLRKALEEAQVELANLRKEDYSGSAPAPAPAPAPTRNIRKLSVPPQLLQQQQQQQQQHQQYQQHDSSAPRKVSNPPTAQASGNRPPLRKASSPNPPAATPTPATPTPTPAPVDTPVPLPTADTTPAPPAESTQPTTTSETPELESESAQPPVDATVAENSSTTEHESLPEVGDYDLLSEKLAQLQTSEPTDSTETTESIESTKVPPTTSSSSEPEVTPPPAAAPTTTTNTTEDEVGTTPPPTDT